MNLREMEGYCLSLLGDPTRDRIGRGDVFRALNVGQQVVARNLMNVDREFFQKEATASVTGDLILPVDFLDPIRVTMEDHACKRLASRDIDAITENPIFRASLGYQQFYVPLLSTGGRSLIRIFPTPAAHSVTVTYVARPPDFHEDGSTLATLTSNSPDATSLISTSMPHAADVGFWDNATIRMKTGGEAGEVSRVTTHIADDLTLSPALSGNPSSGETFELDQTSIIPDQWHDLVPLYAAAILSHKVGLDPEILMGQYDLEIELMKQRWTNNLNQALPGEMPVPGTQRSIVQ